MKKEIINPTGYPYVLYQTVSQSRIVGVGATEEQVYTRYQIHRKTKLRPVNVVELIQEHGHTQTHAILKQHGSDWCVARGLIFYKEMT